MPKVYCDILQYMKNILRFYHNILFITFSHYSKHYLSKKILNLFSICAKIYGFKIRNKFKHLINNHLCFEN